MIILKPKKINTKFKEILQNYLESYNYGHLVCPECGSSEHIRWGHYERNVIFFNDDNKTLTSCVLVVQRIKCKSCGKTHALLPFSIIPYKQFTDEVISKVLLEVLKTNVEEVSTKYLIDSSAITRWVRQFNSIHFPLLSTLTCCHSKIDSLSKYINNEFYKLKYIIVNNKCFMQIKEDSFGLSPS